MKLYFVRHGESEANIAGIFSNRDLKHPLTQTGLEQARALAAQLKDDFARIYSSPIQRARQTADILAQAWQGPVEITSALREWDVGIYEGRADPQGWELHRQVQEDWFRHRKLDSRMPEGESFLDMRARFVPFIATLLQAASPESRPIVLVGHGGLYHAMLPEILHNIDNSFVAQHPLTHTAHVIAETSPRGLVCREWNGIQFPQLPQSPDRLRDA